MTALAICGIVFLVLTLVWQRERAVYRRNQRWLREGPCTVIGDQLAAEAETWLACGELPTSPFRRVERTIDSCPMPTGWCSGCGRPLYHGEQCDSHRETAGL